MTGAALRLVEDPVYRGAKSEPWMEHAACTGHPAGTFFDYGDSRSAIERARRICDSCPVEDACLEHAMTLRIDHGMFGGYTEHERRRLRRGVTPVIKETPPKARPAERVTTGDRIMAELANGPLTSVELQDRLRLKQNTIAHWTGMLRREGSITANRMPGSPAWLYQLCGGRPSP